MKAKKTILKALTGLFLALIFSLMNACNLNPAAENVQPAEVICIHDLQIRPGIDEKEFESFVMNEIAPLYNQMKGQDLYLAKGDRGVREGQYAIIITFASIEDRDRIYPFGEDFSEEFQQIMEGTDDIWYKFNFMAEGFDGNTNTDYVKVLQ